MLKPSFASGQRLVTGEIVCKGDLSSSPHNFKGASNQRQACTVHHISSTTIGVLSHFSIVLDGV